MKRILIVSKTKFNGRWCIGAITNTGESFRLLPKEFNKDDLGSKFHEIDTPFKVGDIYEIEFIDNPYLTPPHIEDIVIQNYSKLKIVKDLDSTIRKVPNITIWDDNNLFEGKLKKKDSGSHFIEPTDMPSCSTGFWISKYTLNEFGHYYVSDELGMKIKYVGEDKKHKAIIQAGTLLRVSLSGLFYWLQLSGWY